MKKTLVFYVLVLGVVLSLFVYFLLIPLEFPETDSPGNAVEEEYPSKYDWDKLISESKRAPPKNLYIALETGFPALCDSEDGIEPKQCREIFFSAQEKCSEGKPFERIFCVAFVEKKGDYCEFISLDWYAVTCRAIIDEDLNACIGLDSVKNRALCVRDLAVNLENPDCASLEPSWKSFCTAHKNLNSVECNAISDSRIREQCLALFNI